MQLHTSRAARQACVSHPGLGFLAALTAGIIKTTPRPHNSFDMGFGRLPVGRRELELELMVRTIM